MFYRRFGLIAVFIILAITLASCSKEHADAPKNYNEGLLTFLNSSPCAVVINEMVQMRASQSRTAVFNQAVYRGNRFQLPNLIDGGVIFKGGDIVRLSYSSKAIDHIGTPLFSKTIDLTVNGTVVIRIKGQDGSYEISGN